MRRLIYSSAARRDLVQILDYIAREAGSATTGRRFANQLREQCRRLAVLPGTLGRAQPELRPGIRSFAFRSYVSFFRYRDDAAVEIVAVLERHRDVDGALTQAND